MYVYLVPAVVKSERLFLRDTTAPVERDSFYSSKENTLLEIEIPGADIPEAVPIQGDGVGVVIENCNRGCVGGRSMSADGVCTRFFYIGCELSRRVYKPNVIAGPRDADHRETRDDHHQGNRDYQL